MIDLLKINVALFDDEGRLIPDIKWKDELVWRDIRSFAAEDPDDDPPF